MVLTGNRRAHRVQYTPFAALAGIGFFYLARVTGGARGGYIPGIIAAVSAALAERVEVSITLQHEDVSTAMHRV